MDYRHEVKQQITYGDLLALRSRLSAVMHPDPHAVNGVYEIRSLYFDNLYDKALFEKINGVNEREKFRIRYYNGNTDFISLEKKCKRNDLSRKVQEQISKEDLNGILSGDLPEAGSDKPLLRELVQKMRNEGLAPKTIVDYTREPFVFAPGNVRVTLDYNIRTGLKSTDFLNPACVTVPVPESPMLLEVKWDAYLPGIVRDVIQVPTTRSSAYSKYASCRLYD